MQLRQRIHLNRVSEGLVTMGDSILEAIQNELCGKWTLQQSNNFDAALQEMGNYFVFCILYYIYIYIHTHYSRSQQYVE